MDYYVNVLEIYRGKGKNGRDLYVNYNTKLPGQLIEFKGCTAVVKPESGVGKYADDVLVYLRSEVQSGKK